MTHPEAEDLTLLALGEQVSTAISAHLATCPVCAGEVRALQAVVELGREAPLDDAWIADGPPPAVWARIADDIGEDADADSTPAGVPAVAEPEVAPVTPLTDRGDAGNASDRRTWRERGRYVVVGVAAAVVGAALALGAVRPWESTPGPVETRVAHSDLAPLDAPKSATGSVDVVKQGGTDRVVVRVSGLPLTKGYYEAWLFDPANPDRMVALGALATGQATTFVLPAGLDLSTFSAVDISAEAFDGDETHSTVSVLRGELTS